MNLLNLEASFSEIDSFYKDITLIGDKILFCFDLLSFPKLEIKCILKQYT